MDDMQDHEITPLLEQFKASAGSGKTFTLTARFLDFMRRRSQGAPSPACGAWDREAQAWPEIMAVTFTNKAAAQMKEKVVAALKARALGLSEPPQASEWDVREAAQKLDLILRHYHRLNIRTIDSLLHLIVRVFALPLGVTPDFDVVFDPQEMLEPLLDETVAQAERGGALEQVLIEDAVSSLLYLEHAKGFAPSNGIEKRLLPVVRFLLANPAIELDNDESELGSRIHASAVAVANAAKAMAHIIEHEGLGANAHFKKFLVKCTEFTGGEKPPESTFASKTELDECLNAKSKGTGSLEAEKNFESFIMAYDRCLREWENLSGARNLAAFVRLGRHMVQRLYEHQRAHGVMLNQTWPNLAAMALSGEAGVPEAFCRLGTQLSAMLVDEFQDTSREQWQALKPLALECLANGGRMFMVGDVKQAIYGWRGGDARLFDEAAKDPELTAVAETKPGNLECNWRSLKRVVAFNNGIFTKLGEPETAKRVAGAMTGGDTSGFSPLAANVTDAFADARQNDPPGGRNPGGHVKLMRVRGENIEGLTENIHEALEHILMDDLLDRRPPGDVAVLVRTNSEAALVSQWLVDWRVPVVTENSLRLGEHPLIREMLSALAFLDYPLDDTAFFEFVSCGRLLHPIGGPSREALFSWLAADPGKRPLYRRFAEEFPQVWNKLLAPFVRRSGLMGPYDTVCELARAYGLLGRFPEDEAFLRRFLEVVYAAEQSGRLSLSSFLEYWNESGPEEKVPLPEHLDAVRVLTMHKAKGLEFPAVVAPFHHWPFKTDGTLCVHDFEGLRLLAPLRKGLGKTWDLEAAPIYQEQLHLLYVAWTRPREELYCLITSTPKTDSYPICKALDVLLEDITFTEDDYGQTVFEIGEPPETSPPSKPEPKTPPARPMPEPEDVGEPMAWLPRLKIHRNLSLNMPREELLSPSPAFDERMRGDLFHEALDMAAGPGKPRDPKVLTNKVLSACPAPCPAEAAEQLQQALSWIFGHDELAAYLDSGRPEASIMDEAGNLHRPDLLATGKLGTCIVEYKTGATQPEHQAQVRRYLKLIREMNAFPEPLFGMLAYLDQRRTIRVEVA
jgi:ATP-dependent exoDNAse (exonuclease V) beta subunit